MGETNGKSNHYPDADPDGLGDLKEIKRIKGMRKIAPNIAWGQEFNLLPIEGQLKYAKRLASVMNHAADVLQTERNKLLEICAEQERKLKAAQAQFESLRQANHDELQRQGAENQKIYAEIVQLKQENKHLKKLLHDAGIEV